MDEKRKKSNRITIYLIKEDIKYEEILKPYVYNCVLRNDKNSITYYYPTTQNKPIWLTSYFKYDQEVQISNSNAKVISLHKLKIDGKELVFAIPFGNGKTLLNDDVIEEQFGIKILLNSVPKDGFRQLNIANYGGDHRTKSEQTPKKTDISEFGFDIYNDFLRKATAKSEEELFNKNTITGGDLFNVAVPITIDEVDDFIISCYRRYNSEKYKENFSWLDNIKEVKEKSLKTQLNEELLKVINERLFDRVWMAVPEIINWEDISAFRFKINKQGYDDIEIGNLLELYKDGIIPNIDTLKNRKVYAMNNDGDTSLYEWSIYNCIIAEIEYKDNVYCLNFGKWYKVNKDFVKATNEYYDAIQLSKIEFPNNNDKREDSYNKKLATYLKDSILMDKATVRIKGMGKSSVEVCDVLTSDNCLIHVKKNGGSSYLSHLFNQAAVSGEMLLDVNFRNEVNSKIGKIIFDDKFLPTEYTIILAIITKNISERPKIPFFSKVSIQYSIDGLIRKGYKVQIKNIYSEVK